MSTKVQTTFRPEQGTPAAPRSALAPSEYTAALIKVLGERKQRIGGANVLEVGIGSGVVLATLARLGAKTLTGVDVEADAVTAGFALLGAIGFAGNAFLHRGDMWEPVAGQSFDVIAANLPHFPMDPAAIGDRRPSWSAGGNDGRRHLDRFLAGLPLHLAKTGRAYFTHNAFVDLENTHCQLATAGLEYRTVFDTMVTIPPEKSSHMPRAIREREEGKTLFSCGPYIFAHMAVLEVGERLDAAEGGEHA